MFGGIITRKGTILSNAGDDNGYKMTVETDAAPIVKEGDSVGINGVCLTVTGKTESSADFDVWPESLKRTTLADLTAGTEVHLDLPLKQGEFIGGHPILGHVDYVAALVEKTAVEGSNQLKLWFELPAAFRDLVPPRGSIAVNGVSLTVTDRSEDAFSVSLIPETLKQTFLGRLNEGDKVNIEVDFSSRNLQDSSGVLSLSIPDENRSPAQETALQWAVESLKSGGAVLLTEGEGESYRAALVAAGSKLTAEVLTFCLSLSRTGTTLAISTDIAEQLAIPAPVINHPHDEDERRYLIPINHPDNHEFDFSAPALLKTISLFCDSSKAIGDWKCPGNVTSVQIYSEEVKKTHGVLEGAVALMKKAGLPSAALCQTLLSSSGNFMTAGQVAALAARFELPCVTLEEAES